MGHEEWFPPPRLSGRYGVPKADSNKSPAAASNPDEDFK
jgi:hypothetical protein